MNISYKTRNFLIAAVLGLAAAAITLAYTASSSRTHTTPTASGTRVVYVATRDIPIGTAGAKLADGGWVRSVKVAPSEAASGAVSSVDQLASLVAVQQTYRGEQIVARRFGTTQQEGIVSTLHGTLRVYELPGDAHQLLAGILKNGNHVDVVGSLKNPESGGDHYSKVVIHDLVVVDAPDKPSGPNASPNDTTSVDLMVTTDQAQRLFWLEKNGDWSLLLRPSNGADNGTTSSASAPTILGGTNGR